MNSSKITLKKLLYEHNTEEMLCFGRAILNLRRLLHDI